MHKIEVYVTVNVDGRSETVTAVLQTDGNPFTVADFTLGGVRSSMQDKLIRDDAQKKFGTDKV